MDKQPVMASSGLLVFFGPFGGYTSSFQRSLLKQRKLESLMKKWCIFLSLVHSSSCFCRWFPLITSAITTHVLRLHMKRHFLNNWVNYLFSMRRIRKISRWKRKQEKQFDRFRRASLFSAIKGRKNGPGSGPVPAWKSKLSKLSPTWRTIRPACRFYSSLANADLECSSWNCWLYFLSNL